MSLLDTLIATARKEQQDETRKKLDKNAKRLRKLIGGDLYDTLGVKHNEHEGVLEFTARGVRFFTGSAGSWGVSVCVAADYRRPFGRSAFVSGEKELLLFIDNNTSKARRRVQSEGDFCAGF